MTLLQTQIQIDFNSLEIITRVNQTEKNNCFNRSILVEF